jgi:hypothetical protein
MEPQIATWRNVEGSVMKRRAITACAATLLFAAPASATQSGITAIRNWHAMDDCAHKAQLAYPDFTPDSNAKRDAKLKECLEQHNLPPRAPSQ